MGINEYIEHTIREEGINEYIEHTIREEGREQGNRESNRN